MTTPAAAATYEIRLIFACGCVNTWMVGGTPPDEKGVDWATNVNCVSDDPKACSVCRGVRRCPHRVPGPDLPAVMASLESMERDLPQSKRPHRRVLGDR